MCAKFKRIHVLWLNLEDWRGRMPGMLLTLLKNVRQVNGRHENTAVYVCVGICLFSFLYPSWTGASALGHSANKPQETHNYTPGDWPLRVPTCSQTQIASRQWISTLSWLELWPGHNSILLTQWRGQKRAWNEKIISMLTELKEQKSSLQLQHSICREKGSHLMAHNRSWAGQLNLKLQHECD